MFGFVAICGKQHWSGVEKYFSRSWIHIFYFWKLRQIIPGKMTRDLLESLSGKKIIRVMDLGCGPGTNVFDVYDVCAEFNHVQWILGLTGYPVNSLQQPI